MNRYTLLYYSILKYQKNNFDMLKDNFNLIEIDNPSLDRDDLLENVDVILAPLGYHLDKSKIDKCTKLKAIGSNTTGHPHIDIEYAHQKGIAVVTLKNEKEFLDTITPTAELTWGLLIALTRNIVSAQQFVKNGRWDRRPFGGSRMLSRMKMGVVGLGRLGARVANYALNFGMEVSYYDPYVSSGFPGLKKCDKLEELVACSDVISVHVPHEKETERMFSWDIFSKFKKGAYFINTSRGELVDHAALLNFLENGLIGGAALDVFEGEFVPGFENGLNSHPLLEYARNFTNLIISPHIGGSTYDAWYETERHTIESILKVLHRKTRREELPIMKDQVWAIIPARGGSKTIPFKNLALLNGKPLIEYAVNAARSTSVISRTICSTDNIQIKNHCQKFEVEVQDRPDDLSQDNISTVDVLLYFLDKIMQDEKILPEYLVLLEPTSPFVTRNDIETCIKVLQEDSVADSAQTVTRVSSNSHAYNQRFHDENGSHFLFKKERKYCFNKQLKPEFYIHGNVRVMRVASLIRNGNLFGEKSIPIEIPQIRAMDVDGGDDLIMAESIIKSGVIDIN